MKFRKLKRILHNLTHPIVGEIWELHRVLPEVSKDKRYRSYEITPEYLEQKIKNFLTKDYSFISIEEMMTRLMQKHGKKCVVVTLDDGYEDNYLFALPIFEKYHIPFIVYISPGLITGEVAPRKDDTTPMMSIEQIQKLAQHPLCTIGNHTWHHYPLYYFEKDVQKTEIETGEKMIEKWIGKRSNHISLPFGSFGNETINLLKNYGYLTCVRSWGGPIRYLDDCLLLNRKIISMPDDE